MRLALLSQTKKRLCIMGLLLLCGYLGAQSIQDSQPTQAPAHYLKAAWMVNFIKFVRWPRAIEGNDRLKIAIYGDVELSRMFGILEEQTIRGKQLEVIYIKEIPGLEDLKDVQVLYVSEKKRRVIPHLLKLAQELPLLTISDMPNFIDEGGIMAFQREDHLMLFEINQDQALNANLYISSKILGRAKRVIRPKSN